MKRSKSLLIITLVGIVLAITTARVLSQAVPTPELRTRATQQQQDGNFKDAYQIFRRLCLDPGNDGHHVGTDLGNGVACLRRLGRIHDIDELIESTVKAHAQNWRLLRAAAELYQQIQHHGHIIAGEYHRGPHRGGGKIVNSLERDRVRAMQLMQQAIPHAREDDHKKEVADFHQAFAGMLLYGRGLQESWRLQYLTDLGALPDYDQGYPHFRPYNGAPVDEQGNPVFHHTVTRWEDAATDGQRWRWTLDQVVENNPARRDKVRSQQASFYQQQFGVQSMVQYGWFFRGAGTDDGDQDESGTYALHTLDENETIAKLATGIKRFPLPDEFNFIKIYRDLAKDRRERHAEDALHTLAEIFANRRQYPTAAGLWQQSIREFGDNRSRKKQRRNQIVANWGRFEPVMSQPADKGATVEYRFRNGKQVHLEAHEIDVNKLLADVKAYLKSDPRRIDWQRINIANLGYRLVHKNQEQYIGQRTASWNLDLEPREDHFDKRTTINTPLQEPGAYLVTARMQGGNTSKIIIWVSNTAIVKKQLSGKSLYYVADAVTGKPVQRANLEFFGYKQRHVGGNRYKTETYNFAEQTDASGQVMPDPRDLKTDAQWLVIARTRGGRLAHLGFQHVWDGRHHDAEYEATKVFCITDRPVYRPEQTVHFKLWVRHAKYDKEDTSSFANRQFPVEIRNPKGEKVLTQELTTDEYGGIEGKLDLPSDSTLGVYNIGIDVRDRKRHLATGGTTFRVEEYKKPEFDVTIEAPGEPVMLGETIKAKITAKYYFGSPVVNAKVKFKVMRTEKTQQWYPHAPWDWCYGPGYWWFGYDYPWYPGWQQWVGCRMPWPWWWEGPRTPPELVAEHEVEIGSDGTVTVEIDTAVTKELHGDKDHSFTITAEVTDESRRTIVGTGKVLVARKPFKVFSWVNRGYYRVGDVVIANFRAQTLDRKPVQGKGVLTLLKITYDKNNEPLETPVREFDLNTNEEGTATQQLRASANGQYRLSYKLTDAKEHVVEGGYLFTVIGQGFDGKDYRFNNLELIPDKREYAPGETVKLQINTDRVDSTVLLFVRPANGVYLPPKMIRLRGKSTVHEVAVVKKDMPNFFVEAVTVSGGKVYSETKEIVVPPQKRIVNVDIRPSEETYKPGQPATVRVKLTDMAGEPIVGSTVMSIYDKSVEYISGGSNVPDIKEFFWKWRRRHQVSTHSSLMRQFNNHTLPKSTAMQNLGVFGATVAEELDAMFGDRADVIGQQHRHRGRNKARPVYANGAVARSPAGARAFSAMAEAPMEMEVAADGDAAGRLGAADADLGHGGGGAGNELVEPTVRSEFADTALWVGSLVTDRTGTAEVALNMPENLTTWKIKVWSVSHGTKVGAGEVEVVTRKNVILRMQTPRFFVQKDEVVLSANVHNYLENDKTVSVSLELPGSELEPLGGLTQRVTVSAGGEHRVDWRIKVVQEGQATVRMKAMTDEESDAMEMKFPVYVHGMLKTESWAGTVRPEETAGSVTFAIPSERRINQSLLEVRYSPTLAGAMVDALPYLADYPYGCTEQTLNRFLPTVITQKVLLEMNLDLAAIREKRTNLNAQELGEADQRAKQWKRFDRNPVFDETEVQRMVKDGVKRLTEMQNSDGGWGWFSGREERSWPHTTCVVVHGLQIAQLNDIPLVPGVLDRGIQWLKGYQQKQVQLIKNYGRPEIRQKRYADNLDALVHMVLVDADVSNDDMRDYLYRDRNRLAVYAKAMYGLALEQLGEEQKLAMILRNIEQYLVQDTENETAYLKLPADNYWWYWWGSETEANAYYLKLLARVDARGKTAPRLVKYLLNNRKHATYWRSTRDTAVCVESFADYLRSSGEMTPDMVVEIWLDGQKRKEVKVDGKNLFTFDNRFVLRGDGVKEGSHKLEIRRRGKGPVYFNVYSTNFTLEDHITRAGLEVKVDRKYYKLVPVEKQVKVEGRRGQALDQRVEKFERIPLENLSTLTSGDQIEIELVIESKNDYEYLIFEDMKAAGFEPVSLRSGYTNNGMGAYMELRDNRVSFFVRHLARGKHSVAYRMRAEIPGKFSALPTRAYAMYAPELKGNSDEMKLRIVD